jgi:hypothetical protein
MNEKEFIYSNLNYLKEEVRNLHSYIEKQQNQIEYLTNIIEVMQSPNYIQHQLALIEKANTQSKIDFIHKMMKK